MRSLLLALLLLTGPATAHALDLLESYQLALTQDLDLRAARAAREAALEARPLARSALLPQLSASASLGCQRSSQRSVGTGGSSTPPARDCQELFGAETRRSENISVALSQTVFSREAWLQYSRSAGEVALAELDLAQAEQDLLLRVAVAYFNVLAADDDLRFSQAERDAVAEQRELAEQRFEVGLTAITDVQEAQARYDLTVAQSIAATQAQLSARDALEEIINARPDALSRPTTDFVTPSPEPDDVEAWLAAARQDNYGLRAAELAAELAGHDIDIARARRWPSLSLDGRYGKAESGGLIYETESREVLLSMNLPIYQGGRIASEVRRAVALSGQRDAERAREQRRVERAVREAFQQVRTSRARIRALEQAVRSNATALEASEIGVQVGTRTAVDILNAQQALFGAQRDLARARYDYLIGILQLKSAAGRLVTDDLVTINALLVRDTLQSDSDDIDD